MTTQTSIAKQEEGAVHHRSSPMPTSRCKRPPRGNRHLLTGDVEAMPGRSATPFVHRVDTHRDLFNSN